MKCTHTHSLYLVLGGHKEGKVQISVLIPCGVPISVSVVEISAFAEMAPSHHHVPPAHHKHLRLSAAKHLHSDIKHLSFGLRLQSKKQGLTHQGSCPLLTLPRGLERYWKADSLIAVHIKLQEFYQGPEKVFEWEAGTEP